MHKRTQLSDSRISGLYRLTVVERIAKLQRSGWLSAESATRLLSGRHVLSPNAADKIIENVVGVFGLPMAIAPNFVINGRDHMVPMVIEEPSVVAGLSNAAKLARLGGGFTAACPESLLAGQVHVADVADVDRAVAVLERAKPELLGLAQTVHPRLVARGGGVREVQIHRVDLDESAAVIAVHILVDTCDAMGANLVNAICEAIAPKIAALCGGKIALRILSNLADRSIVTAQARFRLEDLVTDEIDAITVRDGIILASRIASADPYRAATHNKGVMNGIDAVAIATGNDWRAIEAGAHAYAAVSGRYSSLTRWSADDDGNLIGEIRIPLKVGIVGATVTANPAAAAGIEIAAVASAIELAELMAAAGLAQNFAALRALASRGIQHGHMRLHARSVAAAAGVPDEQFDKIVEELILDGDISISRAKEKLADEHKPVLSAGAAVGSAAGKIILLGEHAAVYGKHALALPIPAAVQASVEESKAGTTISVSDWNLNVEVTYSSKDTGLAAIAGHILNRLNVSGSSFAIRVRSNIPPAMGLGASAALAVAIIRAFDRLLKLGLNDDDINATAFECEKLAHGTPSGVDNAVATYAAPILFRNAESLQIRKLVLPEPPPVVIAYSGQSGMTKEQVAGVRRRFDRDPIRYGEIFSQIDEISQSGAAALENGNYAVLGQLMNICHGLLNAIEVSTPELESMISIARASGALGAKLTGSGGGGSIVALCPDTAVGVTAALRSAGYQTLSLVELKELGIE